MTVELYGNALIGVVSADGASRSLYVSVSKPYGKTFNNVSFDSSATFNLVGIAGVATGSLDGVRIRDVEIQKQTASDTTVVLGITIHGGTISSETIYRASWSVPKLTLT